jgi:large subunit ribosomal protein L18
MATREIRKNRSKKKLQGDAHVLVVFRSNKHILAQVTEPTSRKTLFTVTSATIKKGTKTEKSLEVGKKVAELLKKNKIEKVIFDRNGFLFHGRIKALAEAIKNENIAI